MKDNPITFLDLLPISFEDSSAMEVAAYEVVHAPLQELLTTLLHLVAILALDAEEVALELDALGLQRLVVALLHVEIALGMSQDRGVALVLDALQESAEVHRGTEDAGFYQEVTALVA